MVAKVDHTNLLPMALESWFRQVTNFMHDQQPPLGTCAPTTRMRSVCACTLVCLCKDPKRLALEKMLILVSRGLFKKGAPLRPRFDNGRVVLRFSTPGLDSAQHMWFWVGDTNLTSWATSWMRLYRDWIMQPFADVWGSIALKGTFSALLDDISQNPWDDLECYLLREAVLMMDPDLPWFIQIYELVETERLVEAEFLINGMEVVACSPDMRFFGGTAAAAEGKKPGKSRSGGFA